MVAQRNRNQGGRMKLKELISCINRYEILNICVLYKDGTAKNYRERNFEIKEELWNLEVQYIYFNQDYEEFAIEVKE